MKESVVSTISSASSIQFWVWLVSSGLFVVSFIILIVLIVFFVKNYRARGKNEFDKKEFIKSVISVLLALTFALYPSISETAQAIDYIISRDNTIVDGIKLTDPSSVAITQSEELPSAVENLPVEFDIPQKVADYSNSEIVILIDKSSSMHDYSDQKKVALDAAGFFIYLCQKAANCRVSVLTFSDKTQVVINRKKANSDYKSIINRISGIEYDGDNTNICDGLNKAKEQIEVSSTNDSKKMILLISDGKNDVGDRIINDHLRNEIINNLDSHAYSCPIYTIGLNSHNENYEVDSELIVEIAQKTGAKSKEDTQSIQEIFPFLIEVAEDFLGAKLSVEKNISLKANQTYYIKSDVVENSDGGVLSVFGDTSIIHIDSLTSGIVINQGNNYYTIPIDNSDNSQYEFTMRSDKDTKIKYSFLYNFDISLCYSMSQDILIGQPFSFDGNIIASKKINSNSINGFLKIYNEEMSKPHICNLQNDNGKFSLNEMYAFSKAGNYTCEFIIKDKNKAFKRSSGFQTINVMEPKVSVKYAEITGLNTLQLSLGLYKQKEFVPFDLYKYYKIEVSTDKDKFIETNLSEQNYVVGITFDQIPQDIFIKLSSENNLSFFFNSLGFSKITKEKLDINNSEPHRLKDEPISYSKMFSIFDAELSIPIEDLKEYYYDESGDFNITFVTKSTDTTVNIVDNQLVIGSNRSGKNVVWVYAQDKEDKDLFSEPVEISFNIKFPLNNETLSFSFLFIVLIALYITGKGIRNIKYGELILNFDDGIESGHIRFYGKQQSVYRLLKGFGDRRDFAGYKLVRTSPQNTNVKLKKSFRTKRLYDLSSGITIHGRKAHSITLSEV